MIGVRLGSLGRPWPWERAAIGIAFGPERTVAVEWRGRAVAWELEGPGLREGEEPESFVREMFAGIPAPARSWTPRRVTIALAQPYAQCRRLFGFPLTQDERLAAQVLRGGMTRFFRRVSSDLVAGGIVRDEHGAATGAVYHGTLLRALLASCAAARLDVHAVVPMHVPGGDTPNSPGGSPVERIVAEAAAQIAATRQPCPLGAPIAHSVPPEIARGRVKRAGAAVAIATLFALVAPVMAHQARARRSAEARSAVASEEAAALEVARALSSTSEELAIVARGSGARPSRLALLSSLTTLLPRGAVVIQLQLDTLGGTLVTLAPSADAVMKGLGSSTSFSNPELIGPVSRERIGERELERASLSFRLGRYPAQEDR